jgi:ABC-2 type transport system permease protein
VTRVRWATGHYGIALGGSALLMLLTGVVVGLTAAASLGQPEMTGRVLVAALAQIPAVWVVVSLVMLAFGWVPRATAAVWGLLVAFIVVGEFGSLWTLPEWVMDLSPLRHAPTLPVQAADLGAVLALTAAALALSVLGYLGWRRRDLSG